MKILSKLISALVSAAIVITGVTVGVPFTVKDITASAEALSGVCGEGVEWSFDSATGDLNITGTGKMRNYALYSMKKEMPWYDLRGEIEAVKIHEGVTRVGDYAFYDCPNVTDIELPTGLEAIGTSAFENCKRLCFMVFPCTLTEIGGNIIKGTQLLEGLQNSYTLVTMDHVLIDGQAYMEEATVPETVTCIASEAFSKNNDIEFIYIPDSVTDIGIQAFGYCKNLSEVRLPEGLTKISTNAFISCKSLESIDIPDSVSVISEKAFYGSGIKEVTLSQNVKTVGSMAFGQCPDIESITFYNRNCNIYDSKYTISNSSGFTGTIYGYKNSTAEAYADKYGYKFIPIGGDEQEVTTAVTTTVTTTTTTVSSMISDKATTLETSRTTKADTSAAETSKTSKTTAVTTETSTTSETETEAASSETTDITTTVSSVTTTITTAVTKATTTMGDANGDGKVNVRDAAFIANKLASKTAYSFPASADFNGDGKVNVRDAAAIAAHLAKSNSKNSFYPYMLLDMKGYEITGKYGPSEIIEYPAEGGDLWCIHPSKLKNCYAVMKQVTNNPYAEDYSPSFRNDQKPFFISISSGYASEKLRATMPLSELLETVGDLPLYFSMMNDQYFMEYSDGKYSYRLFLAFPKNSKFIYPNESDNLNNLPNSLKKQLAGSGVYVNNIWISKR